MLTVTLLAILFVVITLVSFMVYNQIVLLKDVKKQLHEDLNKMCNDVEKEIFFWK